MAKEDICLPKKTRIAQSGFVSFNSVKEYINEKLKTRSSDDAIRTLLRRFNTSVEEVLVEAKRIATANRRKTILDSDITAALELRLGKRHLNWEEILQEIILQTPADLGKISKGVRFSIEKDLSKK